MTVLKESVEREIPLTSLVWATVQQPGLHKWPEAVEGVKFLQQEHRHVFHIKVAVRTSADNSRSVEFFALQSHIRWALEDLYNARPGQLANFGSDSCEHIAYNILRFLRTPKESLDVEYVEVSEDGENGAIVGL